MSESKNVNSPIDQKLKVLVVPSDRTGVSYYRSTIPHIKLEEYYPNDFHVDIDYEPDINNVEFLKQYDIIHYHRTLGDYDNLPKLLDDLNIKIDNPSLVAWDLCVEGIKKYLYFAMPFNFRIMVSNISEDSTVIDLRGD